MFIFIDKTAMQLEMFCIFKSKKKRSYKCIINWDKFKFLGQILEWIINVLWLIIFFLDQDFPSLVTTFLDPWVTCSPVTPSTIPPWSRSWPCSSNTDLTCRRILWEGGWLLLDAAFREFFSKLFFAHFLRAEFWLIFYRYTICIGNLFKLYLVGRWY